MILDLIKSDLNNKIPLTTVITKYALTEALISKLLVTLERRSQQYAYGVFLLSLLRTYSGQVTRTKVTGSRPDRRVLPTPDPNPNPDPDPNTYLISDFGSRLTTESGLQLII